ncbi:MAG: HEAT repeat domain-containing protein [Terracidiphilus sp.]
MLPLLGAQSHSGTAAPAASAAVISDAEADQIMQDITNGNWEKTQPAEKKVGNLNSASKAKLAPRLIDAMGIPDSLYPVGSDHPYRAGYAASRALANIGAPVLPALEKVAQNATGQKQQYAVEAIGNMKPKARSAIPVLLVLAKTADKDLRGWVIESLGKIGPAAPGAPTIAPTLAVLMAALNDNVDGCEDALGNYGAPAVPGLRKFLQTSSDSQLRLHAIKALTVMEATAAPATPELMAAIKNPAERQDALWALVKIGPGARQAMPVLKKVVLKDPEYWTAPTSQSAESRDRGYAMQALINMGVNDTDFLIQAMKGGAPGAIGALSKLGAAIVPTMRTMLSDANLEYRKDALAVLGAMGAPAAPAVPDIVQTMAEKDLRIPAIFALEGIGPGAAPAVPALINALLDEDVRYMSLQALAAIGPGAKDAVPYLIDILQGKPRFTSQPPPPGYQYKYGQDFGERMRSAFNIMNQLGAKDALIKIGTPEALAAVKEYDASHKH